MRGEEDSRTPRSAEDHAITGAQPGCAETERRRRGDAPRPTLERRSNPGPDSTQHAGKVDARNHGHETDDKGAPDQRRQAAPAWSRSRRPAGDDRVKHRAIGAPSASARKRAMRPRNDHASHFRGQTRSQAPRHRARDDENSRQHPAARRPPSSIETGRSGQSSQRERHFVEMTPDAIADARPRNDGKLRAAVSARKGRNTRARRRAANGARDEADDEGSGSPAP